MKKATAWTTWLFFDQDPKKIFLSNTSKNQKDKEKHSVNNLGTSTEAEEILYTLFFFLLHPHEVFNTHFGHFYKYISRKPHTVGEYLWPPTPKKF